jgi:protein phosphatase 1 regulatory subunit 10
VLDNEDLMEERTRWKSLIPIDLPPLIIEPGKDSKEKDIQYAREKGILQALYFNRSMYVTLNDTDFCICISFIYSC